MVYANREATRQAIRCLLLKEKDNIKCMVNENNNGINTTLNAPSLPAPTNIKLSYKNFPNCNGAILVYGPKKVLKKDNTY